MHGAKARFVEAVEVRDEHGGIRRNAA